MAVISITAVGTRGGAKGKVFIAKPNAADRYVLNRKRTSPSGAPTNYAVNKVYVETLDEAAALMLTSEYLINLVSADGTRALRELSRIVVKR